MSTFMIKEKFEYLQFKKKINLVRQKISTHVIDLLVENSNFLINGVFFSKGIKH